MQLAFEFGGLYLWQWHGREMFSEIRNDPRFSRKLRRTVYHLADTVEAPDEAGALNKITELYPESQTLGLINLGPVKKGKND